MSECQLFGYRSGPTFVGPDLGPNCLQRLSADNTSRQRVAEPSCQTHLISLPYVFNSSKSHSGKSTLILSKTFDKATLYLL